MSSKGFVSSLHVGYLQRFTFYFMKWPLLWQVQNVADNGADFSYNTGTHCL